MGAGSIGKGLRRAFTTSKENDPAKGPGAATPPDLPAAKPGAARTASSAPRQNFSRRLGIPKTARDPSSARANASSTVDSAGAPDAAGPSLPVYGGKDMSAFLRSTNDVDENKRNLIFGPEFQDAQGFRRFFAAHLDPVEGHAPVSAKFDDPQQWTTQTFQALFAALWLQHPTEKGMYTIDITHLSKAQIDDVRKACEDKSNGTGRISSHYGSGQKASSMSEDWKMLTGYNELMVQVVTLPGHDGKDRTIVAMKAEGAKTDLLGGLDHLAGYASQKIRGVGLQRSPELNKLARESPLIALRAAENFPDVHKKLLRNVGLDHKDRTVLARDMTKALFKSTGYPTPAGIDLALDGNEAVGRALHQFCDDKTRTNPMIAFGADDPLLTPEVIGNLRAVADAFIRDGSHHFSRVHCEAITTPQMLDAAIDIVQRPSQQRSNAMQRAVSSPLPRRMPDKT